MPMYNVREYSNSQKFIAEVYSNTTKISLIIT